MNIHVCMLCVSFSTVFTDAFFSYFSCLARLIVMMYMCTSTLSLLFIYRMCTLLGARLFHSLFCIRVSVLVTTRSSLFINDNCLLYYHTLSHIGLLVLHHEQCIGMYRVSCVDLGGRRIIKKK